jgi:hypothetical protein
MPPSSDCTTLWNRRFFDHDDRRAHSMHEATPICIAPEISRVGKSGIEIDALTFPVLVHRPVVNGKPTVKVSLYTLSRKQNQAYGVIMDRYQPMNIAKMRSRVRLFLKSWRLDALWSLSMLIGGATIESTLLRLVLLLA